MSNQRGGKFHAAAASDSRGGMFHLGDLIRVVRNCQEQLEQAGEGDAALRFEIFGDWLAEDVAYGKPMRYENSCLNL